MKIRKISFLLSLIVFSFGCGVLNIPATPTPEILGPPTPTNIKIILQRLQVDYLGQDGHTVIGSGCPGVDGKGSIEDYHFVVNGVSIDRNVKRVLVAGDTSTLTWEWPCSDAWSLVAEEKDQGRWDVFIAPSLPTEMYTIVCFYDDNSMALGMVTVP